MHRPEVDQSRAAADQQEFDEAVQRVGKRVVRLALGLGIAASITMSAFALAKPNSPAGGSVATAAAPKMSMPMPASAAAAAPAPKRVIDVSVLPTSKKGPDGKTHDAFSVTTFNVTAGQPVTLHIDNKDDVQHSITSPTAGVNIQAKPGVHDYTLVVNKAGTYQWMCVDPCDTDAGGWAMSHPGYMMGTIVAS